MRGSPVNLPYGNSRSIALTSAILAPMRVVARALEEPVEIVRWIGREAWGFPHPGGALDIVLDPDDLGLEEGPPLPVHLTFREIASSHLLLETTDPRNGRPIPIAFTLSGQDDRTVVALHVTGLDPSNASDPFYRAVARAGAFHLANLKSVLETGDDLRATIEGALFRFEGTAIARGEHVVRAEVRVRAPRAAAFFAFTDPDTLAAWWPGEIDMPAWDASRFEAVVSWGAATRHHVIGTLVSWTDQESLRLEWVETTAAGTLEASALIAFLREGEGARVIVIERSGAPLPAWGASLGGSLPGWDGILARLARSIA